MERPRKRKPDGEKIFSIVISLAIVAALTVGTVAIVRSAKKGRDNNYIDLNLAEETKETKTTESVTKVAEVPSTIPETEAPTEATTPKETAAQVDAPIYNFDNTSSLLWPVDGQVILGYNMDSTIYFPTLNQYKCNPAIIVGAEAGTPVLSAAAGVVEDIYDDAILGKTMVVSVGGGYKVTYGQLSELAVNVSDKVEAGTVLGKVAEPTRYFQKEGSNLYFGLTCDGKPVDPTTFLIDE